MPPLLRAGHGTTPNRTPPPFLFKQHGEWLAAKPGRNVLGKVLVVEGAALFAKNPQWHHFDDGTRMARVGKRAAGRLLDGLEYDGFPEVK